ncbi:DUF2806 domain-containing protein [Halopseudomonas oceani]|uniref:DUF2806 domain-containing protein n=1 Tax=Halopseudomonas oceani TaxID=1708783 RepID=UPI002AA8F481|nr:DUF2806 domain-containing protein [Halopseudomonas oceani]
MGFPGEQLVIKLWETLAEKGVGSLLTPWQIKRNGAAQAEIRRREMLLLAQTELDIKDLRDGNKTLSEIPLDVPFASLPRSASLPQPQGRIEPTLNLGLALKKASSINISDTLKREINTAQAIFIAEEVLKHDDNPLPQNDISEDWLYRWRDCASEFSSETMQKLWGKVLAGELKSPDSFSLRTLDFIRNLSPTEAISIQKIFKYDIDYRVWRTEFLEDELTFGYILELQNLGIISGVGSEHLMVFYKSKSSKTFDLTIQACNLHLKITNPNPKQELHIPIFNFTSLGRELFKLANPDPDIDYLNKFADYVRSLGFKVLIC